MVRGRAERFAQQRLRLFAPALGRAHEAERHARRRERGDVVRADGLHRLDGVALGLVDVALADEDLREQALTLAEVGPVAERREHPDRLSNVALCPVGVARWP